MTRESLEPKLQFNLQLHFYLHLQLEVHHQKSNTICTPTILVECLETKKKIAVQCTFLFTALQCSVIYHSSAT